MIFPELRRVLKDYWPDGSDPISLNLKDAAGVTFNTVDVEWYTRNGYPEIAALLSGGAPTWSGENISRETALQHSVVWACNRLVSESVGSLPASVMIKTGKSKRDATDHPMYRAMHDMPNDELSAQCFREMLTSHCLLGMDGFAKIVRRSGTNVALELQPILPEQILADREKVGQKRLKYTVTEPGNSDRTYFVTPGVPQDIFHLRGLSYTGLRGYNTLSYAKQSIGSAIATERNVAAFWKNGGRVPYMIEMAQKFRTDQDYQKWRADWETIAREPHRAPIGEPGMKYVQTGLSMADNQAIESRQWTVSEVARWFGVSPHLVNDLSRATFSNVEHLYLEFKVTLARWTNRWNQDFKRCVLTDAERSQGYFLYHNLNALMQADFKTRMEGYASALQNGHMNIDEVRDLEDRNPLPNRAGQKHHIQTNMGTIAANGQVQQPQPPQSLVTLDTGDGNPTD